MVTARQKDVLGLLARGLSSERVGELLGISPFTVKEHSKAARRALGARNTAHAVSIALHARLIEP
jgi:DNA-binding CsgD family transcriptional regulator